ncbi:MAG: FliA/WhiG family RNA polymerase sigma factor [Candidatus Goldbacteria bacterium]|nr:FliA/WhiG family RNA polymerase sigma factor [Candidatus Goldiibacteriota bacterium]
MENINELWKIYKKTKSDDVKERLIKNYLPFVKYLAERIIQHLPKDIKENIKEDLYIEGIIGLIEAIEKFDIDKKIKFETFASKRIRGAMIDILRKEDFLSKNIREQAKRIEKAYIEIESETGKKATDDEISKKLGMTKDEFYDILNKIKGISIIPLELFLFDRDLKEINLENLIGRENTILSDIERNECISQIANLIEQLETEERLILELYYWDELTLKEIGQVLNLSESRVSQIHTKILLKLKSAYKNLNKER